MSVRIAPSILSADFAALGQAIAATERGGADLIHVDVMDGHFVPNITIGPPVVRSIRHVTKLPLDVHLMIMEPDRYIEAFADAGASMISVHVEVLPHLHRTVHAIKALGANVAQQPHDTRKASGTVAGHQVARPASPCTLFFHLPTQQHRFQICRDGASPKIQPRS